MSRIGWALGATASHTSIGLKEPARGRSDCRGARILRLGVRQRGIDNGHRERVAQRLAQRDREGETGKAGSADGDLGPLT